MSYTIRYSRHIDWKRFARLSKKEKMHIRKAIEEKLQHILGTKVRISHGQKRGKFEIDYYSLDDLDRVLKILKAQ